MKAGVTYALSGCPSGFTGTRVIIYVSSQPASFGSFVDSGSGATKTLTQDYNGIHFYIRILKGTTVSNLVFYPMVCVADEDNTFLPFTEKIFTSSFDEIGTIYGGILDILHGKISVTHAIINSYAGEDLPGVWISDRDVYSPGTTPSTGAQVVYKLADPINYNLTPKAIKSLEGKNNIWSMSGTTTVEYGAFLQVLQQEIEKINTTQTT